MNNIFNYYGNKYVKIIRKDNKKIIYQGKVSLVKVMPCQCISIDNKFFFPIKSNLYDIFVSEIELENLLILDTIEVYPWRAAMKLKYEINGVYRENDINGLDEGIKDIVKSFNNANFHTTGSCDGHHEYKPWVDIEVNDLITLKRLNIMMNYKNIGKNFTVLFDCINHPSSPRGEIITILSKYKGDKGLLKFKKLQKILDII